MPSTVNIESGSARSGSARSGSARSGSARSGSARSGSARSYPVPEDPVPGPDRVRRDRLHLRGHARQPDDAGTYLSLLNIDPAYEGSYVFQVFVTKPLTSFMTDKDDACSAFNWTEGALVGHISDPTNPLVNGSARSGSARSGSARSGSARSAVPSDGDPLVQNTSFTLGSSTETRERRDSALSSADVRACRPAPSSELPDRRLHAGRPAPAERGDDPGAGLPDQRPETRRSCTTRTAAGRELRPRPAWRWRSTRATTRAAPRPSARTWSSRRSRPTPSVRPHPGQGRAAGRVPDRHDQEPGRGRRVRHRRRAPAVRRRPGARVGGLRIHRGGLRQAAPVGLPRRAPPCGTNVSGTVKLNADPATGPSPSCSPPGPTAPCRSASPRRRPSGASPSRPPSRGPTPTGPARTTSTSTTTTSGS